MSIVEPKVFMMKYVTQLPAKTVLVPCPRSPGRVYIPKIGLPTGKKKNKKLIQFILHFISQSSSGDNQTTYPTNLADTLWCQFFQIISYLLLCDWTWLDRTSANYKFFNSVFLMCPHGSCPHIQMHTCTHTHTRSYKEKLLSKLQHVHVFRIKCFSPTCLTPSGERTFSSQGGVQVIMFNSFTFSQDMGKGERQYTLNFLLIQHIALLSFIVL